MLVGRLGECLQKQLKHMGLALRCRNQPTEPSRRPASAFLAFPQPTAIRRSMPAAVHPRSRYGGQGVAATTHPIRMALVGIVCRATILRKIAGLNHNSIALRNVAHDNRLRVELAAAKWLLLSISARCHRRLKSGRSPCLTVVRRHAAQQPRSCETAEIASGVKSRRRRCSHAEEEKSCGTAEFTAS